MKGKNSISINYAIIYAVMATLIIVTISLGIGFLFYQIYGRTITISSTGPTVESISKLKELVTLKVSVGDVLIGKDDSLFGAKICLVVSGDALISVDLSKSIISKDVESKTANIGLVEPRVLMARVNQEKTAIYDVKSNSLISIFTGDTRNDLLKKCMVEAQKMVERAANNEENLQNAKSQAEIIIKQLYSELGWTIDINWSSP